MDVVYVVRQGDRNDELRWSLRSLAAHLPHGRVWVAGYKPAWIKDVGHIPARQDERKWQNSTNNLRVACAHPEVAEEFLFFNDDFFVMQPVEAVPVLHRGPAAEVEAWYRKRHGSSRYIEGMAATSRFLSFLGITNPLSYELHIPMPVNKERMAEVLALPGKHRKHLPALQHRSLYANYWRLGGEQTEDCKITGGTKRDGDRYRELPFISTSDNSFRSLRVGRYIKRMFPDPSPYEVM